MTKPDLNKWYHVAFIRNTAKSKLELVIHDQNRTKILTNTFAYSGTSVLTTSKDLEIGGNFTGYIDEVRVSNVVRSFEVVYPPIAADIPTPSNGATHVDFENLNLKWFLDSKTTSLDVLIGQNNPPTQKILDHVSTRNNYTVTDLKPNTDYYWQVISRNEGGETPSAIWKFTTKSDASITVTKPNGGEMLRGGTETEVKWSSKNMESIKIELSTDSGNNWQTLSESTPASDSTFTVMMPEVEATTCLIRISDAANSTISDISDDVFALYIPFVELTYPENETEIKVGEEITIQWNCAHVEKLNLEFSSDNGENWETLASELSAESESYTWIVPEIISEQCKLKLSCSEDPTISYTTSWTFNIVESTSVSESALIPKEYELNQNFPNPFNPITSIQFAIPNSEYLTLKVYDLLGMKWKRWFQCIKWQEHIRFSSMLHDYQVECICMF